MNKDLNFEYIEEFANYTIGRVEDDDELFVTVVGKFDTIKPLLKEVMGYEFVDFESIEIGSEIMDNYTDEFVLSLWMNDGVLEIGCEKLKRDGVYVSPCGDETYLMKDCSSKIIPLCEGSNLYFVNIEDECDCDDECCGCCDCDCDCCEDGVLVERSNDNNGDTHGFTASKSSKDGYYSFSYYTNDKLSEEDIRSMLKEYGF